MFEWLLLLIQIILVSKEININTHILSSFCLCVSGLVSYTIRLLSICKKKKQKRKQTKTTLKKQRLIETITVSRENNKDWFRNGLLLTLERTQASLSKPLKFVMLMFLRSEILSWLMFLRNTFHVK